MLLMKSHITYLLSAESMPNHAEIYANWGHCEDQLTAKNMELSKGGLHIDVETFFTSFDLVIFLNLIEDSSRLGSSAATIKKPSHLVECKTVCDLSHKYGCERDHTMAPCSFSS